jgi:hypothetical protein
MRVLSDADLGPDTPLSGVMFKNQTKQKNERPRCEHGLSYLMSVYGAK